METNKRSIVKTITWRITGSTATFLIAYLLTDNLVVSSVIGVTQIVTNTILYYMHERLWNSIKWGRNNV